MPNQPISEAELLDSSPTLVDLGAPALQPAPRTEGDRKLAQIPRDRHRFNQKIAKTAILNPDPNFHYHWFNEDSTNFAFAEAACYTHVKKGEVSLRPGVTPLNTDLGDKVSMVVGRNENGTPVRAFLMKQPIEIWRANQQEDHERRRAESQEMQQGRHAAQVVGNSYLPRERISLDSNT